ncbi:MAPEG family protein [Terricaulis silvestris]|uniref:Inner membrane protein YecN n=1 Tax=Terricaulis silvestris TaxID=2686094 RepID=A0A6I6MHT6_9CAUL|nr:MAPEG family protein [Terricaulis silvestris]QGZ94500.1 Inner membrane protein YecN [Terricaulis silvestris]
MLRLEVVALYAGVNILILLVLAVLVMMGRRKHKIVLGDGANEDFNRAVRAHANAAEYIPAGLIGLVLLALLDPAVPLWLLHAAGLFLTAGRIFHGVGLHTGALNAGRGAGILLTWISFLLIAGGLIYAGFAQQL